MANSGVNVKMGVTGVAQFKQNISTAKNSLKTLDAQLALNEKQFKQTGDAETYMQQKSELLKVKLEEQKAIAANCEKALAEMTSKGVDKASKAFQDMQRQLLQAKGDIIDTENAMQGIVETGDKVSDNAVEMNRSLKDINKGVSFDNVTNGIGKITETMEKAFSKAMQLGKAIVQEVLGAGSWADDLATRAKYYQITEDELQRMEKTAQLIDTPVEAIISARKKLKKETAARSQETMGAYAALGINPDDAKDAEELFWRTGEAIMRMGDEYEQEAYAQKLFGRSWNELIPLFEAGRKEYEELNDSWNVVPEEQLKALAEMDDQYQKLNNELETVKMTFLASIAPALTGVMGTITDLLEKFNEYLASPEGQEAMKNLGDTISKLVEDLVNVDPNAVVNGIASAIQSISDGLNWVKENKELVVNAIKGIGAAFGLLKVGELATNIWKVVDGFKHLGGGSGVNAAANAGANAGSVVGTAAKGGLLKSLLSKGKYVLQAGGLPLAVVGGTMVASIALNNMARNQAVEKYENELAAAEQAAAMMGGDKSGRLEMIRNATNAMGYVRDANGNYKTGVFGTKQLGDWAQIGSQVENFAAMRNEQQAILYNMIRNYAPYTAGGWDTIGMLEKVRNGTAEQWEKQETLQAITQAYTLAMQDEAVMGTFNRMSEAADDLSGEGFTELLKSNKDLQGAANDLSKLPKDTASAVQEALNGARVVIDGGELTAIVGQLMAGMVARYSV